MVFFKYQNLGIVTPMFYLVDLMIVNLTVYFLPINLAEPILFHAYITISWIILSTKNEFYSIYRYTKVPIVFGKIFVQFFFFFLILYAFIGFFKQPVMSRFALAQYAVVVLLVITTIKMLAYIMFMEFRGDIVGGERKVVVLGKNKKTDQLVYTFKERVEYGYQVIKQFSTDAKDFEMHKCFQFILKNEIHEIY